jgi:hypothetical protein
MIAKVAIVAVAAVLYGLVTFHAGVSFGERRTFSRVHGGPSEFSHSFIPNGHGAIGTIASITPPTMFVLNERDGDNESVSISSTTVIRKGKNSVGYTDLVTGENVVVIGDPSESSETITARIIHIIPQ